MRLGLLLFALHALSCRGFAVTNAVVARPATPRPAAASTPQMAQSEPPKTGGVFAALAAIYVAAHLLPILTNVPPAGAVEALDDDILELTSQGATPVPYAAALAVTVFSVLPTPGMVGLGKGDDVYDKKKKGFGFKSLDDVIETARDATDGDVGSGGSRRSGGPKMMAGDDAPEDWRRGSAKPLFLGFIALYAALHAAPFLGVHAG